MSSDSDSDIECDTEREEREERAGLGGLSGALLAQPPDEGAARRVLAGLRKPSLLLLLFPLLLFLLRCFCFCSF